MKVTVKFIGPLKSLTGIEKVVVNLNSKKDQTISSLIQALTETYGEKIINRILNSKNGELRPNILILKNDVEIRVLDGLKTEIKDEDVITFIPVSHSG